MLKYKNFSDFWERDEGVNKALTYRETALLAWDAAVNGCGEIEKLNKEMSNRPHRTEDIMLLKLNKRLAIYQKAINEIDDYFEYRYAQFDRKEIRKHVYDVLDNLAKKLEATKTG